MTPDNLSAWMARLDLNKVETCRQLGIARTTLDNYLSGRYAIPKLVELACEALEQRRKGE